ncbi:MAG: YmdB family metallophosphoesterase [Planctomycetia bacterium]|nr:YmdB family metallophosphoesterase [Planctomycetia bacterium]
MRILFLGDIVGPAGIVFLKKALRPFVTAEAIDLVIANAENATNGMGITPAAYRQVRETGVDLVTLGDHVYKKSDIIDVMQKDDRIGKPANLPPDAPGREFVCCQTRDGVNVAAFSLLGRTYMRPVDCPYRAADRVLKELEGKAKVIIVDIHAEATGDKYLMGHYLKGRVSAVLGTHTHVPTADEQLLPGGTAYISDVGMTGPYDSVLGRRVDRVLSTTISFIPCAFDVATGDPRLAGAIIEVDPQTGKASAIRRVMLDEAGLAKLLRSEPTAS